MGVAALSILGFYIIFRFAKIFLAIPIMCVLLLRFLGGRKAYSVLYNAKPDAHTIGVFGIGFISETFLEETERMGIPARFIPWPGGTSECMNTLKPLYIKYSK